MYKVGVDIGSTTIKCVVINEKEELLYKDYKRHKSSITASLITLLEDVQKEFNDTLMLFNFTGSAGMLLAKDLQVQFTQEVISATKAIKKQDKDIDVCIELGGENHLF